jgi:hypothetical protein
MGRASKHAQINPVIPSPVENDPYKVVRMVTMGCSRIVRANMAGIISVIMNLNKRDMPG